VRQFRNRAQRRPEVGVHFALSASREVWVRCPVGPGSIDDEYDDSPGPLWTNYEGDLVAGGRLPTSVEFGKV
jgi:hypothetical protein